MKEMHLLCNAHLDPVWLWQRPEGVAEAISTFRVAAAFCEEYDGFIFNHNESLLYEWIEEHEPELFKKIQRLVSEGKWHIMGGWYLQPDCTMPCGESFIRQIETGNRYFIEKFSIKPTCAINFDPFGHTRGLVQILKKCGYDSYIVTRAGIPVPERDFLWKGFDGSEIVGHKANGYGTGMGKVLDKLNSCLKNEYSDNGINLMLWGIGNHGGGPSRIDLEALKEYSNEHPELKLTHSYCEKYISTVDKRKLRVIDTSLVHCMVGCYTTMSRIKKLHRMLENELSVTEKMLAASKVEYDREEFKKAEKALLFCEFHDILPGTAIKNAEEDSVRVLSYGLEITNRLKTKAFFALCSGQKKANDGEIPILIFNPNPYTVTDVFEAEFQLSDQNWTENEVTVISVRDEDGNYLPSQNEKESSSLNLDWRKRVAFCGTLKPMSITRFDCELHKKSLPKREIKECTQTDDCFVFDNGQMQLRINKTTGLIDKYAVDGVDLLKKGSGKILVYDDSEDPWAMETDDFKNLVGEFKLLSDDETNRFNGYEKASYPNVRVIENGDARLKVQATFGYKESFAVITYSVPKEKAVVDIAIKLLSNNVNKMYKLCFETEFENPLFMGQTAFGKEELLGDENEVTYQKWCGFFKDDKCFAVLNNGTYGGSMKENKLNISLLRTPVYSAHPICDRALTDDDRCHDHIDMGEREFTFRLTADKKTLERDAESYNQKPFILSFFPSGNGEKRDTSVLIDNEAVILTRFSVTDKGENLIRLFNSSNEKTSAKLCVFSKEYTVDFTPFEVKTFILKQEKLSECDMLGIREI